MKTSRPFLPLVLAALAAAGAATLAAFGQPIDHLHLLLASAPAALDLKAIGAAVEQLRQLAGQKFEALEDLSENHAGLKARLLELEQKAVAGGGREFVGSGGSPQSRGTRAAAIVKALSEGTGLAALRSNAVRRHEAAAQGLSVRAAITSATVSGPAERDPTILGPLRPRSTLLDLIPRLPTTLGSIEYLKSTRTGAAAVQAVEGALKSEVGLDFELVTAKVATVAAWLPASRQVLDDIPGLTDFVQTQLLDAVDQATELQILSGSGLPGNLSGLLLEATPYARAQPGDLAIDSLRRAATQVHLSGGTPTGVVLNPADLEALELQRDLEGRFLLTLAVNPETGDTAIWRMPAVQHVAIAEGTFLLGDFQRGVRIHDREQASVRLSTEDRDNFIKNMVTVLCELRLALATPRPDLLVTGDLVPA
jgi:HK97 family phage major capsid protein